MTEVEAEVVTPRNARKHDSSVKSSLNRHAVPLWRLIFVTLLDLPGRRATVGELVEILEAQGHHLGQYPLRTVTHCAASKYMGDTFVLTRAERGQAQAHEVRLAPGRSVRDLL